MTQKKGDSGKMSTEERKQHQIKFKVVKLLNISTKDIHYMAVSQDGTLWIGSNNPNKLLHVKLSCNSVTALSTFNIQPFSLAISPSGSPFIVGDNPSTLLTIYFRNTITKDSRFRIHPWTLLCVHVTKVQNVIVGGHKENIGVVIVMDKNGEQLDKYEMYKGNTIFT